MRTGSVVGAFAVGGVLTGVLALGADTADASPSQLVPECAAFWPNISTVPGASRKGPWTEARTSARSCPRSLRSAITRTPASTDGSVNRLQPAPASHQVHGRVPR